MAIDVATKIIPNAHVTLTRTGEEGVLVDSSTGQVHVVNATAARAWELCGSAPDVTVASLRRTMAAEYEVPESELEDDLHSLLVTFRTLEVIELLPAP